MRLSLLLGAVIIFLLGVGVFGWWYLFGANAVGAAQLVPSDTVAFATIPNAAELMTGYESSQLKKLVDSPNIQPLIQEIRDLIGQKNADLLEAFLPNLSGQSFVAVTHFDPDKPEQIGLIAAIKPKPGLENFDAFVEKVKAAYPDEMKLATTGAGNVAGIDYQWIQGPDAPDKICVAHLGGWIVTAWGEASLQDWIERLHGKSATPSLAKNPDYQKSVERVGKNSMTLVYVDYYSVLRLMQKELVKMNPAAGDYLTRSLTHRLSGPNGLGEVGGLAIGSRFENGEIVDRFSFLIPRVVQLANGMRTTPCPFETLKFTAPATRFYWASSIDWQQAWMNMQAKADQKPREVSLVSYLQTWAQGAGVDIQHNIIDPLGSEISLQAEWPDEAPFPEVGLYVKLDKPDDFKPTIAAFIETMRKVYDQVAVIDEVNVSGHNFASLKFVQPSPISPTITEDGPYLGVFLTQNQAARSFLRGETVGLLHNPDFLRQIGDKRTTASQIAFLDSPQLLNRAYQTALPALSMAAMFSKNLGAMLKGGNLPPDLAWLAPIGTWSFVMSPDNDGVKAYSVSGIGNQAVCLDLAVAGSFSTLQSMGILPKPKPNFGIAPPVPQQLGSPLSQSQNSGASILSNKLFPMPTTVPVMTDTNAPPAPLAPPSAPAMNSVPQVAAPVPDAATNAAPAPESAPVPATNPPSDATSTTSTPSQTPAH